MTLCLKNHLQAALSCVLWAVWTSFLLLWCFIPPFYWWLNLLMGFSTCYAFWRWCKSAYYWRALSRIPLSSWRIFQAMKDDGTIIIDFFHTNPADHNASCFHPHHQFPDPDLSGCPACSTSKESHDNPTTPSLPTYQ